MDDKIKKENKVPGCDRLTRPEEIQELSKYLKQIKEVQEEYVEKEINNLEAPGITTGNFPKVKLPETIVELDTNNKVNSLSDSVYQVPGNKNQISGLETSIKAIEGDFKNSELENRVEKITDQRENRLGDVIESLTGDFKEQNLENNLEKLEDTRKINLENSLESLTGDFKEQNLENNLEKLEDTRKINLESNLEPLTGTIKNPELSNKIETIKNTKNPELENELEKLSSGNFKEPGLSDFLEKLNDDRDIELGRKITGLNEGDFKDSELENRVENLSGEFKNTALIDDLSYQVPGNKKEVELSDKINSILSNSSSDARYDNKYKGIPESLETEKINYKTTSSSDARSDLKEYNYFDVESSKLSDYEKIFKVLDDIEGREGVEGYVDKLRSLISAYLVNQSIDESQALAYLDKLKGCFIEYKDSGFEQIGPSNPDGHKRLDYIDNNEEFENIKLDFLRHQKIIIPERELKSKTPLTDGNERVRPDEYNYLDVNYDSALPENSERLEKAKEVYNKIKKDPLSVPGLNNSLTIDEIGGELIDNKPRIDLETYDFINNSKDYSNAIPEKADKQFKEHQKIIIPERELKSKTPLTDGNERIDGDYDYLGDNEDKIKSHFGAANDGNKVEDGIYLRPYYQLPFLGRNNVVSANIGNSLSSVGVNDMGVTNINTYLRQIAEWVGDLAQGSGNKFGLRAMLVNETLHILVELRRQLEKATNANRDRLPGNNNALLSNLVTGGLSGAANKAIDSAFNSILAKPETDQPLNRPSFQYPNKTGDIINNDISNSKYKNTINYQDANNRSGAYEPGVGGVLAKIGDNLKNSLWSGSGGGFGKTNFKENYLFGNGIYTTLMELCETSTDSIDSVEELQELLKTSPYITTPTKFGTIESGRYGTTTLDTNSNWEIILEPFVDDNLNGGFSYLPAIQEINFQNYYEHGIKTYYNKWIPFVNFSLQKSRMTSKTLGLYDGEISYPISAELTNELRLTLVDDQYKSWRHYFQKCMDVSVYNSEPHNKEYYDSGNKVFSRKSEQIHKINIIEDYTYWQKVEEEWWTMNHEKGANNCYIPTAVDKSNICVAFYKNLTFRVRLFVMTPQLSTIRRFDLLCVLKDFTEEYEGDIDSPGADLSLTFSIVGENPIEKKFKDKNISIEDIKGYNKGYSTDVSKVSYDFYKGQTDPSEAIGNFKVLI